MLRELNRPLLLALYTGPTAPGPARWALLLGLSDSTARLQLNGRDLQVSLPTLAVAWREEFGVIWQLPAGTRFNGKGSVITVDPQWLLAQLARARGEPAPDNARPRSMPGAAQLRAQIRAFQRAHGLELDGLPGALTLMLLQRSADDGLPRLRP